MRLFCLISLMTCCLSFQALQAQDYIERVYFPGAQARNAAIAAARYAEEAYHYTRFTTYISALDSSRIYADTALFFVKRSLMLSDTTLFHAPRSNTAALDYLHSGRNRVMTADSVIREFYPMVEIKSHHYFGKEAAYHLSNTVMDFFSASLLLRPEIESENQEIEQYDVLPFDDEILRLEADETAFQHLANSYDRDVAMFEGLAEDIRKVAQTTNDQETQGHLYTWLGEVETQIDESSTYSEQAAFRIQEIRILLDRKYLKDLENVEEPEHLSQFDTESANKAELVMDADLPDGLAYKIQLGYYPSDVDINNFRGLFPITGETVRKGVSRIYAGLFFSYTEASAGLDYVRNNAIANAFIVPLYNGNKIGMSRAVEIEKARGVK